MEIGTKISGYLPKEEIEIKLTSNSYCSLIMLGVTRDFFLVTRNICTKQYVLSIKRLDYIRAWKRIKQIYEEDIVFDLRTQYVNRGGMIVYLEGIQGFIPGSHLINRREMYIGNNRIIKCKLLSFDENKNQLILSNKSAKLSTLKHKFKLGELVYGKIVSQKPYGIFLDIYNMRALLHVSEISNESKTRIERSSEINQLIKIKIIYINSKDGLISTSIKEVKQEPILLPQY